MLVDETPKLPEGLLWALFVDNATGRLWLVNRDGERFSFDRSEAPHVAAALAEHCDDDEERAFVADEWGERW